MKNKISSLVPQKIKNYLFHWPLALLALVYFRFPAKKIKVIGVTGTDGKTTTVSLIYHILKTAGLSVAMISTVSAKIGSEEIDTGFHVTAPNPWSLQKLLRRIADQKIEFLVLEVTSHGLDQFRLFGIKPEVGVLTNITHEHIDYHKTFGNYREAKLRLLKNSKIVVLNKDDESYEYLRGKLQEDRKKKCFSYALKNEADFTRENFKFETSLLGEYNLSNCLAAIAAALIINISAEKVKKSVASFEGVAGRLQEIDEGQDFGAIVDFAHTPNALEQVLKTLKEQVDGKGRLIAVFGAAGLRDRQKRSMMGGIAGKIADLVVLTSEDPRTEKVENICEEIANGCRKVNCEPEIIYDRTKAIKYAINKAEKGDIVVVCGKGHEKSMCFGNKEYPWSDYEVIRKALREVKL